MVLVSLYLTNIFLAWNCQFRLSVMRQTLSGHMHILGREGIFVVVILPVLISSHHASHLNFLLRWPSVWWLIKTQLTDSMRSENRMLKNQKKRKKKRKPNRKRIDRVRPIPWWQWFETIMRQRGMHRSTLSIKEVWSIYWTQSSQSTKLCTADNTAMLYNQFICKSTVSTQTLHIH